MLKENFFVQVDYKEFRRRMNRNATQVSRTGYETVLYDAAGDLLGIMHAASIDERGKVHPTDYFLRRSEPAQASTRLVA